MAPSRRSARRPAHNASASNSKSSHSPQADDRDSPPPATTTASGRKSGALKRVKEEPTDDMDDAPPAAAAARKRGKGKAAHKEDKDKSPADEPEPQADEEEEESGVTRCPCGRSDEELGFMIMCDSCKVWQHGACMGVVEDQAPDEYFCEECRPDLHTDIPAKRKRTRNSTAAPTGPPAGAMPPPGSRSHSPNVKPKSPKRRNTMNSRDAAYDEQIKRLLAQTESGEADAVVEEPVPAGVIGRGKRKRSSAGNEDMPGPPKPKRPRSASTASDLPIAASALHDAGTPAPSANGTATKAVKNGAPPKEPPPPPPPPVAAPPRPKKRAAPRKEKEKEQSVDTNGDGKKHPNQYTYRKQEQERRRAERADGGYQPSGARRKGDGRAQKGDRDRDTEQPMLATWALPDYLQHLAHILPSDPPQPLDEDGVKVKWPGKRMTIGDMNKRVRNIVEFVAREQATSEQRRRRVDALAVARADNRRLGVTAASVSRRGEDEPVVVDDDADAMAVDGEAPGEGIWDVPIGPQERTPTTEQLMSDLMNDLIAFQEKFGMSKASASGRGAARREAAVVASDRNGAAAAAAAS